MNDAVEFHYNGRIFRSYASLTAAAPNGMSEYAIRHRIKNLGMSVKDAVEQPSTAGMPKYFFRGRGYKNIHDLSLVAPNRACDGTISRRLRDGWTIEDALTAPVIDPRLTRKADKVRDPEKRMVYLWMIRYIYENKMDPEKIEYLGNRHYQIHTLNFIWDFIFEGDMMTAKAIYKSSGKISYPVYKCPVRHWHLGEMQRYNEDRWRFDKNTMRYIPDM